MVLLLNMNVSGAISMAISISRLSRSLMNVVSILIRFWVTIAMILLLNMNISRAISVSWLSRSLAISMVISFWMVNLNLVIRVRSVDILVAITTVSISCIGRSLLVIMINLISIRSMIMVTVLVDIGVSMAMVITITRLSRSLAVITSGKSLSGSVDIAASSIPVTRLSLPLAIITAITC